MTVRYSVVPKRDPHHLEAAPLYYPAVVSRGHTDLRGLAGRIQAISTVSSIDTLAVLEGLLMVVPDELARGQIVDLGELGTLRLTVQARGQARPERAGPAAISAVRVRFKPGRLIRKALADLEFRKV